MSDDHLIEVVKMNDFIRVPYGSAVHGEGDKCSCRSLKDDVKYLKMLENLKPKLQKSMNMTME